MRYQEEIERSRVRGPNMSTVVDSVIILSIRVQARFIHERNLSECATWERFGVTAALSPASPPPGLFQ